MENNTPILVTGSHRSGSTWTGKIIARSSKIGYVHEPFNVDYFRPGLCSEKFNFWYQYITDEDKKYLNALRKTVRFKYDCIAQFEKGYSLNNFLRSFIDWNYFSYCRLTNKRALIKDPLAVLSVEILAKEFDMQIIILIRHPAAFIASLKKKNWNFDFNNFLQQKNLLNERTAPFKKEIGDFAKKKKPLLDQGILLWNIIHSTILDYRNRHPEWFFVRHEDLSKNPQEEFTKIFRYLKLPLENKIKKTILETTTSTSIEATHSGHHIKRNSQALIKDWQKKLSGLEIEKIKKGTKKIWPNFYSESDWH